MILRKMYATIRYQPKTGDDRCGIRAGRGRRDQLAGCPPRSRMEIIVRIRRTILAPAILAIGATGALMAGPILSADATSVPAAVASGTAAPASMYYHG